MKHHQAITSRLPGQAQFESSLQFIGLLNTLLAFYTSVANTFGIPIPQKMGADEGQ